MMAHHFTIWCHMLDVTMTVSRTQPFTQIVDVTLHSKKLLPFVYFRQDWSAVGNWPAGKHWCIILRNITLSLNRQQNLPVSEDLIPTSILINKCKNEKTRNWIRHYLQPLGQQLGVLWSLLLVLQSALSLEGDAAALVLQHTWRH